MVRLLSRPLWIMCKCSIAAQIIQMMGKYPETSVRNQAMNLSSQSYRSRKGLKCVVIQFVEILHPYIRIFVGY